MSPSRSRTRRAVSVTAVGIAVGSLLAIPAAEAGAGDANCPATPCIVASDLYSSDQDNQVMDPGFERTPSSQLPNSIAWQNVGTPAWKVVTDTTLTTARNGLRSAVRNGTGTATSGTLLNRYSGEARPGEQFDVSGWVNSTGANATSTAGVIIAWYDLHGVQISATAHRIVPTAGTWTRVGELATAPAGTVSARAGFSVSGESAGIWHADDLVARQRTELPGFGLIDKTGTTGVTQSVDSTKIQKRVTGTCAGTPTTTRSIASVNADGTVGCVTAPSGGVLHGSLATVTPIVLNGTNVLEAKMALPIGTWRITATMNYAAPNLDHVITIYERFECKADSSAGDTSGFSRNEENIGPDMTAAGTLTMNLVTTVSSSGGNVGIFCSAPNGTQGAAIITYKDARIIATPEVSSSSVTLTTS